MLRKLVLSVNIYTVWGKENEGSYQLNDKQVKTEKRKSGCNLGWGGVGGI